jgi:lactam utilization protein B
LFLRDGSLYHFRLPLTRAREELRQHDAAAQQRRRDERGNVVDAPEGAVLDVGSQRVLVHADGERLVAYLERRTPWDS